MTAVEYRGTQISYRTRTGRRLAVDRADLTVASGEFLALVGPSGCGKSTLLKAAAGLVEPTAGQVLVGGAPVGESPARVGMVFQNDALLPWRSVIENVRLPLQIDGGRRGEQDGRIAELLDLVGLSEFGAYLPRQLSGGMRKRVALARTLASDPTVFLMDEPFGPLDALTRREISADFLQLWERLRTTVIFVTHDVDEALLLADRVAVMSPSPGRIVEEFEVPLQRPRDIRELRFTADYHRLYDAISDALGVA
ncbi:ABC transporter ATP-binding protein [Mycolicibacterium monacense]|uniref:ABC transporter ATP-binding protein n=2 Tax=Mycobacteriaceae TaxID=1762 RepID=A0AAD1MZE2_MYCMB|nr:ABC transporter ATP-binding protein [Mycolicibacterium monacense]OBF55345.1 ABC transporter ATP-binding protein [Mycolicibacterium monacense]ORB15271.1 ABC transporter ATP-binding protein [Mycolicibacterium monacense DSM 44395]QHP86186.1 ABC transporter ATP-binding protein [Mycolicibacterium monacense DSM 44395]BBZ60847.1 ABC transporter ATP-binding protein [Mycolicibacterium monacense]